MAGAKSRSVWRCRQCGYIAPKWLGRCPDCGEFGTLAEEAERPVAASSGREMSAARPILLAEVVSVADKRAVSGIAEFDRVLGGGLVKGSLVLLGGEPGIGKSTLLLQVADAVSRKGTSVLYVSGEESPSQIKMRAERLNADGPLALLPETDIGVIEATALAERPGLLVIDSIQTMADPESAGVAGSVGQVRACTARLMRLAKDHGITTLIVGHVTKEGAIAGPRVLEHMVDTVLYFEGDTEHAFRIVRAVKNRFGPVSEIGVFEMREEGLVGVDNPSAALLAQRPKDVSGSVVMATMEGSRPLLVEIQALVSPTYLQMPRRLATGIDTPRLLQVLAVLERRVGLTFGQHDVYVSVAGGVRVAEPAVDLALALALASARSDAPVPEGLAAFGEVGLAGEVRPVSHGPARLTEIARLGLSHAVTAASSSGGKGTPATPDGLRVSRVTTLREAVGLLDGRRGTPHS
jgi:DNA repair protein RadA/Sms